MNASQAAFARNRAINARNHLAEQTAVQQAIDAREDREQAEIVNDREVDQIINR